ncbi:hypothetical protein PCE1_000446 [Barthelona sp. PCE]
MPTTIRDLVSIDPDFSSEWKMIPANVTKLFQLLVTRVNGVIQMLQSWDVAQNAVNPTISTLAQQIGRVSSYCCDVLEKLSHRFLLFENNMSSKISVINTFLFDGNVDDGFQKNSGIVDSEELFSPTEIDDIFGTENMLINRFSELGGSDHITSIVPSHHVLAVGRLPTAFEGDIVQSDNIRKLEAMVDRVEELVTECQAEHTRMNQELAKHNDRISKHEEELVNIEGMATESAQHCQTLNEELPALVKRTKVLESFSKETQGKLDSFNRGFNELLGTTSASLTKKIRNIEDRLNNDSRAIISELESMESRVMDHIDHLDIPSLRKAVTKLDSELDGLNTKHTSFSQSSSSTNMFLSNRLETLSEELKKSLKSNRTLVETTLKENTKGAKEGMDMVRSRFEEFRKDFSTQVNDISTQLSLERKRVYRLQNGFKELSSQSESYFSQTAQLSSANSRLEAQMSRLEHQMSTVQVKLSASERELTHLTHESTDLLDKADTLEDRLISGMKDTTREIYAHANSLRNDLDEMKGNLTKLEKSWKPVSEARVFSLEKRIDAETKSRLQETQLLFDDITSVQHNQHKLKKAVDLLSPREKKPLPRSPRPSTVSSPRVNTRPNTSPAFRRKLSPKNTTPASIDSAQPIT